MAQTPVAHRTRGHSMSSMSEATDREERFSSMSSTFGDPAAYQFLPRDHHHQGNRVLPLPKDKSTIGWRMVDWHDFLNHLSQSGSKTKACFDNGHILILETYAHSAHEAASRRVQNFFSTRSDNHVAQHNVAELFRFSGTAPYTINGRVVMVDEQVTPNTPGARSASFYAEIANSQTVGSGFRRADLLLRDSHNCRFVLLVKLYRHHVPTQVAITACLWCKLGDVAHNEEWQSQRFVSFGHRPLTEAEFDHYPALGEDDEIEDLQNAVVGAFEELAGNNQIPPIQLAMPVLYSVPGVALPGWINDHVAHPPIAINLVTMRNVVVQAMIDDLILGRVNLTQAHYRDILAAIPADPAGPYERLREHAAAYYVVPAGEPAVPLPNPAGMAIPPDL